MISDFRERGQSELLPRYLFIENLFVRRRVLEVGAVASTQGQSAHFLAERGARSVVACDDDAAAVEVAQKAVVHPVLRFRAEVFDDFDDESFDLIAIADLSPFIVAPERLLAFRRLLAKDGFLVGGLANASGLSFSELQPPTAKRAWPTFGQLHDALSAHFSHVEVATQSPILAYQIAFEEGEGVCIDGSLVQSQQSGYYLAIAGQKPLARPEPLWVQVPAEPLALLRGHLLEADERARELQERSMRLQKSLASVRDELEQKTSALAEREGALAGAESELSRLSQPMVSPDAASSQKRDELTLALSRLRAELAAAEADKAFLQKARADAESKLEAEREKAKALSQKLALSRERPEQASGPPSSELIEAWAERDAARARLASLESQWGQLMNAMPGAPGSEKES